MSIMRRLRDELEKIEPHPTPEALQHLAVKLARECAARRYPQKSLAAWKRHHADLPHAARVVGIAKEELVRIEGEERFQPAPPQMRWLSTQAAAAMLRIGQQQLRKRLVTTEGRHAMGWPWWDGHQWQIPEPALDPRARAKYMASLPTEEPEAHRVALPEWCGDRRV